MAEKFEIGDVVVLKSGGPGMTVVNTGEYPSTKNGVFCTWFVGSDVKEALFDAGALEKGRQHIGVG